MFRFFFYFLIFIVDFSGTLIVRSQICSPSNTISNGGELCKEEILFLEDFDYIDRTVWQHERKLAGEPDYEFVLYTDSKQVCYVKNGKLHIKPVLQDEDTILYGSVDVPNCTGKRNTEECSKTARSFNIIPPVVSASINTKNSFSFRYGLIQVIAKLPVGDWIIPEIRLLPKEMFYGEKYQSGQIRIAMTTGNKNLYCDDRDVSARRLQAGIYVGVNNEVKWKVFIKDIAEGWYNDFHNYSLLWTPDNLHFIIDGESSPPLLGSETVQEATNQSPDSLYVWKDGTSIAPFDREFYVSVGVSVGGMKDFSDNCVSDGKKKPWANNSPKGMLNFWQARDEWYPTWKDDDVTLQVDRIQVNAL